MFFLLILIFYSREDIAYSAKNQPDGLNGNFGCLFDKNICNNKELCINDNLFGTCERESELDIVKYRLNAKEIQLISDELEAVIKLGFKWKNVYTQCVISNFLLSMDLHQKYDRKFCKHILGQEKKKFKNKNHENILGFLNYISNVKRFEGNSFFKMHGNTIVNDLDLIKSMSENENLENGITDQYITNSQISYRKVPPIYFKLSNFPTLFKYLKNENTTNLDDNLMNISKRKYKKSREPSLPLKKKLTNEMEKLNEEFNELQNVYNSYLSLYKLYYPKNYLTNNYNQQLYDQQTYIQQLYNQQPYNQQIYNNEVTNFRKNKAKISVQPFYVNKKSKFKDSNKKLINKLHGKHITKEDSTKRETKTTIELSTTMIANLPTTTLSQLLLVDSSYVFIKTKPKVQSETEAKYMIDFLLATLELSPEIVIKLRLFNDGINFQIDENISKLNASIIAEQAEFLSPTIYNTTGYFITDTGIGEIDDAHISIEKHNFNDVIKNIVLIIACAIIACLIFISFIVYLIINRPKMINEKDIFPVRSQFQTNACNEYQDLCRQYMMDKSAPKDGYGIKRNGSEASAATHTSSNRSSTSSWNEEPVASSMDIMTAHLVLSYMEDHTKKVERLAEEWKMICSYEPDITVTDVANKKENESKNRSKLILPYDHNRVQLKINNLDDSDYINASFIMGHDPKNPLYIITQAPLGNTLNHFWQMIWEQGVVVIVNLTQPSEELTPLYWIPNLAQSNRVYEMHLVSEHIWCTDFIVRSIYIKNLQTSETRTVTQFHYTGWPKNGIPLAVKPVLDFRRKINKSYKGRSCPILIHCSEGGGRSGTFCLLDMVLNRLSKGAKELDISATLEHLRDQRMSLVETKDEFQFVLEAIAEEMNAILNAINN